MKQFKSIIWILLVVISSTGCKKFLEESSQDEVRPTNISDLEQLMVGEGYPMNGALDIYQDFLTDELQCNGGQGDPLTLQRVELARSPFTWSKDMYEDLLRVQGSSGVDTWQILYAKIMGCNTVIAYSGKVTGDADKRAFLHGQALAMRAWYYLMLVNLYGQPYNAPGVDPEKSLGVPLKLKMEVTDEFMPRNTVGEVYRQVEADLKQAIVLMEGNAQNSSVYKMSALAAKATLSRMYLYEEKWEAALDYAGQVLQEKPALTNLSTFENVAMGQSPSSIYNPAFSTEIIWAYGGTMEQNLYSVPQFGYQPPYTISADLISLFEQGDGVTDYGDMRLRTFYRTVATFSATGLATYYMCSNRGGFNNIYCFKGIRTGEMYLNRAEAAAHLFVQGKGAHYQQQALNDLNTLRGSRFDTRKTYVPVTGMTDGAALLAFCEVERRRELGLEGHRWFDLRRYGMPELQHRYEGDAGTAEVYTLHPRDARYTLPIPREVLERNPNLVQNP